jgi:hypothetical protein
VRKPIPLSLLIYFAAAAPITTAAGQSDLGTWLARDATTYVAEQLTTHPRFKGELVRFVVFRNGNPAPTSDELAVSLRDRLADAVIDTPGVRVAWTHKTVSTDATTIDCNSDAVHYYIGLEVATAGNGEYRVELQALDIEDKNWVAGFATSWQGRLESSELRAFRTRSADPTFHGDRAVPFRDDEPDLLAAYLAHDLGCALLRQVAGEYLVTLGESGDFDQQSSGDPMNGVVELVSNNLAAYKALQLTQDAESANAVLGGKAHRIDEELYQYWITVVPTDASSDLPQLSSSAYIHLPRGYAGAETRHEGVEHTTPENLLVDDDAEVLTSTRIVKLRSAPVCTNASVSIQKPIQRGSMLQDWLDDCFALQVRTKKDAVVFFLNHQLNHGLVRLSSSDCRARTDARIARADEPIEYALPLLSLTRDATAPAEAWQLDPDADVYYAIAVSDSKAARALSRHLDRLPLRCTISVHPGLEDHELQAWLQAFSATVAEWQPHVDWQAVRVRNVF